MAAGPSRGLRREAAHGSGARPFGARRRRATVEGDARVQARFRLHADGRPAEGDRVAGRRRGRRRALSDAARSDGNRQDDDDGRRDRGGPAADARDRPQQDARGAAVQRVPHVLPGQRGRVLRLLLRLLPARGLRPLEGPLHREGLGDQPGGRPAAPRGDGRGVRPPRRDRGGLGLLHLRPRLARDLRDEHADPAPAARRSIATRCCASSSRSSTRATTRRSRAAPSACAARRSRCSRPTPRPPSARACSATKSSGCSTSTRSPAS